MTKDERTREAELNRQLQSLDERIAPLAARAERTADEEREVTELWNRRNKARGQWVEFQNALGSRYQASVGKPSTLEEVQKGIPAGAAVVGWLDGTKDRWACVVRPQGDPIWVSMPAPEHTERSPSENVGSSMRLRAALADNLPEWREPAETLTRELLIPLLPHLRDVDHWIVVPSGPVLGVPVEALVAALPNGSPRPLVSYVPSGSMLARLSGSRSQPSAPPRLLAIGDPALSRAVASARIESAADDVADKAVASGIAASKGVQYSSAAAGITKPDVRVENFVPLPGTRREVEMIAALFPREQVTTLLGFEATETNLQRLAESGKLKDYRFVHLATHGRSDASAALRSALFFAPVPSTPISPTDPAGRAPALDGEITAEQIVRTWELDADLVVLSACESGLGREAGGEGYLGFAQALFVKGAWSLVLSRWRVDDRATALLMTRFYQNLLVRRDGLPQRSHKARALDEAKQWLRELSSAEAAIKMNRIERGVPRSRDGEPVTSDRPFEHPYYWAAFYLVGDPN